ncbi:hypothetical protein GCM10010182_22110 [Actinomadura cremea]|nr:hypothetical protein GCM10010182_22110 [Actinomadura cremea]
MYGVAGSRGRARRGTGNRMTPTARRAAALRRRRQIISQTVIDRALNDPRRHDEAAGAPVATAK